MKQEDGGTAFPLDSELWGNGMIFPGMSLRDYFAAKAMQAIISTAPIEQWNADDFGRQEVKRGIAIEAYNVADSMLEAREVDNG